jgi:hypothetical protein
MNHLTPDELVDAVDGTLGAGRQAHLDGCATCRAEATRLRIVLGDAQDVPVPEPSPLFWTHLSTRIREAIAAEQAPHTHWVPAWLRAPVLAPIGALALIVLALAVTIPRYPIQSTDDAVVSSLDPTSDLLGLGEQEWAAVSELIGAVRLEDAQEAGIVSLGDAERAALQLSVAEQRELLRLLQQEMEKAGG